MGILATCEELFGTKDLYEVLGVEKTAGAGQIKKAYHKISLKVHPDRAGEEEKEDSTKKFQCVGAVYAVLSDTERRGLYDETGEGEDEMDPLKETDKDWEEYWRFLFPKVTLSDIEKFEKEYRGSDEEREDLKKAYLEAEGDMDDIAACFRYFGKIADQSPGRLVDAGDDTVISRVVHEPVGVCGMITPWNFPLLQAAW